MIPVEPGDHVSARHDGQILVGVVYQLNHHADTIALLTTNGVATIPADAIVAVESIAKLVRGDDEPYDQSTDGFRCWELAAVLGVVALAIIGAVAMAAAIGAIGTHIYWWLA